MHRPISRCPLSKNCGRFQYFRNNLGIGVYKRINQHRANEMLCKKFNINKLQVSFWLLDWILQLWSTKVIWWFMIFADHCIYFMWLMLFNFIWCNNHRHLIIELWIHLFAANSPPTTSIFHLLHAKYTHTLIYLTDFNYFCAEISLWKLPNPQPSSPMELLCCYHNLQGRKFNLLELNPYQPYAYDTMDLCDYQEFPIGIHFWQLRPGVESKSQRVTQVLRKDMWNLDALWQVHQSSEVLRSPSIEQLKDALILTPDRVNWLILSWW